MPLGREGLRQSTLARDTLAASALRDGSTMGMRALLPLCAVSLPLAYSSFVALRQFEQFRYVATNGRASTMPSLWSGRPAISEDSASGFVASLLGAIAAFASCTGEPSSFVVTATASPIWAGGGCAPCVRRLYVIRDDHSGDSGRAGAGGNFFARCTVA